MAPPLLRAQQPPWTAVPPASTADTHSFAHTSCRTRWPAILTAVIDALVHAAAALAHARDPHAAQARTAEAKALIAAVASLKHDLARDRPLQPIPAPPASGCQPDPRHYNAVLAAQHPSWFHASWLFAECHLYASLRALFAHSTHWRHYDPFALQKLHTLKSSGTAIRTLARSVHAILASSLTTTPPAQRALFLQMAAMSLWGNATDLSLLTSLSYADIQALQASSAEQQRAKARFILANDLDRVWDHVFAPLPGDPRNPAPDGVRVDFVLDNSGFELYTDLLFADWLLSTGKVAEIVFHPKNMPWFVSDVNPSDFRHLITALLTPEDFFLSEDGSVARKSGTIHVETPEGIDPAYFADAHGRPCSPSASYIIDSTSVGVPTAAAAAASSDGSNATPTNDDDDERAELDALKATAARWVAHLDAGRFRLSMPLDARLGQSVGAAGGDFWTEPVGYSEMAKYAPELLADLQKSALVIFKGDLNYRKLTSDLNWPSTTPFPTSLGPLAGQLNILALRTCKADVCVGLAPGVEERVQAEDPNWRVDGKWAVVQLALRGDRT